MMVALFQIVSAPASAQALSPAQQAAVSNLQSSSNALKSQIALGLRASGGFAAVANSNQIVDPTTWQQAAISDAQRTAYNSALSTFSTTSFYTAQQFLTDQANANKVLMQGAISSLSAAAVDLQKVATVNQMLATATDAPSAKATQAAIASAGLNTEVTSNQVAAYNTSLASVNEYATKTGAFFAAANNQTITSGIDLAASNYNKSLYTATPAYTYNSDSFIVAFEGGGAVGFQGFMTGQQVSAQAFFTGAQFYGAQ